MDVSSLYQRASKITERLNSYQHQVLVQEKISTAALDPMEQVVNFKRTLLEYCRRDPIVELARGLLKQAAITCAALRKGGSGLTRAYWLGEEAIGGEERDYWRSIPLIKTGAELEALTILLQQRSLLQEKEDVILRYIGVVVRRVELDQAKVSNYVLEDLLRLRALAPSTYPWAGQGSCYSTVSPSSES